MPRNSMPRRGRNRGFTLIELLVVIVILGLLVGLAAVNVPEWINEGNQTRAKTDIDAFMYALNLYRIDKKHYPTTSQGLEALKEGSAKHPDGYLDNFPERDPWGNQYEYFYDGGKPLIICLGNDGMEGGDGYDADIRSDNLSGNESE
jgi:general secretion pathway protein G